MGGRNAADNYISVLILTQQGKQQELKQLMGGWKAQQDSVHNWGISQGSAGTAFKWVLASYNNDREGAEKLQKELSSSAIVNRFKLLMKALAVCK